MPSTVSHVYKTESSPPGHTTTTHYYLNTPSPFLGESLGSALRSPGGSCPRSVLALRLQVSLPGVLAYPSSHTYILSPPLSLRFPLIGKIRHLIQKLKTRKSTSMLRLSGITASLGINAINSSLNGRDTQKKTICGNPLQAYWRISIQEFIRNC